MTEPVPRVGIGCLVLNSAGEFLVGRRKGSHGAGTLALPGGHLDQNEEWATCAARELLEETDLDLSQKEWFLTFVSNNVMREEGKHYITLFMCCVASDREERDAEVAAQVQNLEPNKCEGWEWTSFEKLSKAGDDVNMFVPLKLLVEAYTSSTWQLGERCPCG